MSQEEDAREEKIKKGEREQEAVEREGMNRSKKKKKKPGRAGGVVSERESLIGRKRRSLTEKRL